MAITLTLIGRTPGDSQWGLDAFTEHYKAAETADVVLNDPSVPQRGDAHPDYPFMFVTNRNCIETGPAASALDVVYSGLFSIEDFPPNQHTSGTQLSSASSSAGIPPLTLNSPVTLQSYSPTNTLSYISVFAAGTTEADEPDGTPQIITITFSADAIPFGFTGDLFAYFRDNFFVTQVTSTIQSQEIVAGLFWHNVATKQKLIIPFTFITP